MSETGSTVVDGTTPFESQEASASASKNNPTEPRDLNSVNNDEVQKPTIAGSLRIWPPTQRTREAVITRLIETLSTPSILSKRYGTVTSDEAAVTARTIEEEAFGAAAAAVSAEDDGIEILQVYSKEISKRMLESVKSRVAPAAPVEANASPTDMDDAGHGPTETENDSDVASNVVKSED